MGQKRLVKHKKESQKSFLFVKGCDRIRPEKRVKLSELQQLQKTLSCVFWLDRVNVNAISIQVIYYKRIKSNFLRYSSRNQVSTFPSDNILLI